jgi:MOSC domain-containing protein YiiM
MSKYKILGVFTGKIAKLSNGQESAITKHPAHEIFIKKHSIDQDEVYDKKHHGGEMRVIHHYSHQNYNHLKTIFPEIADRFVPGSFGENIVTKELSEADLNIGDIYQLGTTKVQLTVCRRPCATINHAYNDDRILKEVIKSGRTGWFYRVLEEGSVKAGDYLELLESPYPGLSVLKLHQQGYSANRFSDPVFLKKCLETNVLDKNWKAKLEEALAN